MIFLCYRMKNNKIGQFMHLSIFLSLFNALKHFFPHQSFIFISKASQQVVNELVNLREYMIYRSHTMNNGQ